MNYTELRFNNLWEAVGYCLKHNLWGKVRVVLRGDHYEIEDK